MQGELRNSFGVSLWEKLHSIMHIVVNFDLHLGAATLTAGQNLLFHCFCAIKAGKRKKKPNNWGKIRQKKFFLSLHANVCERLFFYIHFGYSFNTIVLPCYHRSLGGIPPPGRGIVGKNWSAWSTVRSKRGFPLFILNFASIFWLFSIFSAFWNATFEKADFNHCLGTALTGWSKYTAANTVKVLWQC